MSEPAESTAEVGDKLETARAARTEHRYADAVALLREVREQQPDQPEVVLELGLALVANTELPEASEVLASAVEAHPDHGALHLAHARLLATYGLADRALDELERSGDQPDRALVHGLTLVGLGRYREALVVLEGVLAQRPDDLDALAGVCEANQSLWRVDAWLEAADRAQAVSPEAPWVLLWSGLAALQRGDEQAGTKLLERALTKHPRLARAHVVLGCLAWQTGDLEAGRKHLDQAVAIAPWDGAAQGFLAELRLDAGEEVDLDVFEKPALAAPKRRLPLYLGRILLVQFQDYDPAIDLLRLAVEHAPENVEACDLLVMALRARHEWVDVARLSERIISLTPEDDESGWCDLAYACLYLREYDRAAKAFARAQELSPDDPRVIRGEGILLLTQDDKIGAEARLLRSVELDPQAAGSWIRLVRDQRVAGTIAEAKAAYLKAMQLRMQLPPGELH